MKLFFERLVSCIFMLGLKEPEKFRYFNQRVQVLFVCWLLNSDESLLENETKIRMSIFLQNNNCDTSTR